MEQGGNINRDRHLNPVIPDYLYIPTIEISNAVDMFILSATFSNKFLTILSANVLSRLFGAFIPGQTRVKKKCLCSQVRW